MHTNPTARCATLLPTLGDIWFSTDPTERAYAKALCATCPLLAGCRAAGLGIPHTRGVWGGLSTGDRDQVRGAPPGLPDPDDDDPDADTVPVLRRRRPCGTEPAWAAHCLRKETCDRCYTAHLAFLKAQRRERLEVEHTKGGSTAGAAAHRRLGELPCDPCRVAELAYQREWRRAHPVRRRVRLRSVPAGDGPADSGRGALEPAGAAA